MRGLQGRQWQQLDMALTKQGPAISLRSTVQQCSTTIESREVEIPKSQMIPLPCARPESNGSPVDFRMRCTSKAPQATRLPLDEKANRSKRGKVADLYDTLFQPLRASAPRSQWPQPGDLRLEVRNQTASRYLSLTTCPMLCYAMLRFAHVVDCCSHPCVSCNLFRIRQTSSQVDHNPTRLL